MVRIVLLRLLESLFRFSWLYLIPLALSVGAGVAFIATSPPEYVSYGNMYVEKESLLASLTATNTDGSWWVTPAQATTNEIYELLGTNAFVRSAIAKTKIEAWMSGGPQAVNQTMTYFREAVAVRPNGDKLVGIVATTDDPELSYQMVQAIIDSYIQWRLNNDYQESVVAQEFFENQIEPYRLELDAARAALVTYLTEHPVPVRGDRPPQEELEIQRLQAEVQRAEERLTNAVTNEESASLALVQSESVTRQTYLVIDEPFVPSEAEFSLRSAAIDLVIFVAAGMILAIGGVVATALLDRSLRFPIDVRHGLGLPVLAMVPHAKKPHKAAPQVAPAADPAAEPAESPEPGSLQPQVQS